MWFSFPLTLLCIGQCLAMLACLEVGYRLGDRRRKDALAHEGLGTIEAAIFALLGLLLGFAFAGSMSRLDARRQLVVHEANAIGTAYLRVGLLPATEQDAMRRLFHDYLETRLRVFDNGASDADVERAMTEAHQLQQRIWTKGLDATQQDSTNRTALVVLPALNEMIDVTTASTVALRAHLPGLILVLLLGVALLSSLMAGFGMAKRGRRSVLHAMLYASTISLTIYTVLDLDSPRVGLIRLDAAEQILTDLHQSFAQGPTPLRGTEWLLTRLGDKPVTVAESSTPPSIILQGDATRFSGSGGCNRIMGTFELDGESITFGPAASTEMHCDRGMETEAAFLSIFTKVKTWSVVGGSLDLRDGANQSVAHFEFRKPK